MNDKERVKHTALSFLYIKWKYLTYDGGYNIIIASRCKNITDGCEGILERD